MTNTECNMALVEAFGRLEQLCNRNYGGRHGVTDYIEDMKAQSLPGRNTVSHWEDTLQRLKDVRHKRNKLSHGEVGFQERWATEADVHFARAFYQCILHRQDPLACLRKAKTPKSKTGCKPAPLAPKYKRKGGFGLAVALTLTAAAMVLAIVLILLTK